MSKGRYSQALIYASAFGLVSIGLTQSALAESTAVNLKKAVEEYKQGDFADASGHFYATLNTEFSNATVHYYMASCYSHMNDPESAAREFRIAYALAPNSDIGYYSNIALKYFHFNSDGSVVIPAGSGGAAASGLSSASVSQTSTNVAGSVVGTTSLSGSSKVGDLVQSQVQKEKNIRSGQSQKLADDIDNQATKRMGEAASASGHSLSSDSKEREKQILRLPDDVKSVLSNLKNEYDRKKERQLSASRDQAAKLDESAANLQNLIDQHHSLQAVGSNLYVRNYKKGANGSASTSQTAPAVPAESTSSVSATPPASPSATLIPQTSSTSPLPSPSAIPPSNLSTPPPPVNPPAKFYPPFTP